MNGFAQILVLTVHLWHPPILSVSPSSVWIIQRLTPSLITSRHCEWRPPLIDGEVFLWQA
jgi:hypothetical protein